MHTEQEAKTLWCPMSRPSRPDDCGYQAGNRAEGSAGPDLWPQNTCMASKCAMWRWLSPDSGETFDEAVTRYRVETGADLGPAKIYVARNPEYRRVPPPTTGYCGLAGRPS